MREVACIHTGGLERVDQGRFIGITQRHTAHHHFVVACADMFENNFRKIIPSCLRASMQTARTCCHHHALQEHAIVQQTATAHDLVDGKNQTDRRTKKAVVLLVLQMHFFFVTFADAQDTIKTKATFTTAVDEGAYPLGGVVIVRLCIL